jgi:hypothetical protein
MITDPARSGTLIADTAAVAAAMSASVTGPPGGSGAGGVDLLVVDLGVVDLGALVDGPAAVVTAAVDVTAADGEGTAFETHPAGTVARMAPAAIATTIERRRMFGPAISRPSSTGRTGRSH